MRGKHTCQQTLLNVLLFCFGTVSKCHTWSCYKSQVWVQLVLHHRSIAFFSSSLIPHKLCRSLAGCLVLFLFLWLRGVLSSYLCSIFQRKVWTCRRCFSATCCWTLRYWAWRLSGTLSQSGSRSNVERVQLMYSGRERAGGPACRQRLFLKLWSN